VFILIRLLFKLLLINCDAMFEFYHLRSCMLLCPLDSMSSWYHDVSEYFLLCTDKLETLIPGYEFISNFDHYQVKMETWEHLWCLNHQLHTSLYTHISHTGNDTGFIGYPLATPGHYKSTRHPITLTLWCPRINTMEESSPIYCITFMFNKQSFISKTKLNIARPSL